MTKHSDLIARIEAAEGPSAALFEEAFWAVNPNYADIRRFRELLDAEAWLDAAMMLVPEGCLQGSLRWSGDAVCAEVWGNLRDGVFTGDAATPELALCAAALLAQEASE